MEFSVNQCIGIFVKFFCLLTPFFALSMFIVMTNGMERRQQVKTALKTTLAILVICLCLYFLGRHIFDLFGITLDAFRIGAGTILFLTAVGVVLNNSKGGMAPESDGEISVVPLAIPFTVGPGTIGAILVMSAENQGVHQHLMGCIGMGSSVLCVGALLLLSGLVERLIGKSGIKVLNKLTGLILAALAAQIIFTGVKNFFK